MFPIIFTLCWKYFPLSIHKVFKVSTSKIKITVGIYWVFTVLVPQAKFFTDIMLSSCINTPTSSPFPDKGTRALQLCLLWLSPSPWTFWRPPQVSPTLLVVRMCHHCVVTVFQMWVNQFQVKCKHHPPGLDELALLVWLKKSETSGSVSRGMGWQGGDKSHVHISIAVD